MIGSRRSPVPAALGDALLTAASIAGVICIALVAASFLFNVSLIMFKTGSMAPTIPAGSVALVREIPAGEVAVGDIITVDRPGQLPVTHRVTSTTPGATPGERVLTMKGDANDIEDHEPYVVDTVRITLAHAPGIANVIAWFGKPTVLGAVAVAASALVTWAFWPRDEPRPAKSRGRHA